MWGKAHGRAVLSGVAAIGIVAGLSGCSGQATFDSAKDLCDAIGDAIKLSDHCTSMSFDAGTDDETGTRLSTVDFDSTFMGFVFDEEDLDELVMRQAAVNYDGISTPDQWTVLTGDNWSVWAEYPDGELEKLQDKIGGELHKPEADD